MEILGALCALSTVLVCPILIALFKRGYAFCEVSYGAPLYLIQLFSL
jgi:hypothetical protein